MFTLLFVCELQTAVQINLSRFAPTLTTVATVGAGDELLRLFVTILLFRPQTEAADGDGLCHRLMEGEEKKLRESQSVEQLHCLNENNTEVLCVTAYIKLTAD